MFYYGNNGNWSDGTVGFFADWNEWNGRVRGRVELDEGRPPAPTAPYSARRTTSTPGTGSTRASGRRDPRRTVAAHVLLWRRRRRRRGRQVARKGLSGSRDADWPRAVELTAGGAGRAAAPAPAARALSSRRGPRRVYSRRGRGSCATMMSGSCSTTRLTALIGELSRRRPRTRASRGPAAASRLTPARLGPSTRRAWVRAL